MSGRESNDRLASLMAEAKASNKGLAKRVCEVAQRHGDCVGTTHVSVKRWLHGTGIKPSTATYLAEALSERLRRKITPADLGFPSLAPTVAPVGIGYPASVSEALAMLKGLERQSPNDASSSQLLSPDLETDSAVLSWLVSRPDTLTNDAPISRHVTVRDVAAIRHAAETFMQLDFLYGGGHGHKALRYYFREEVLPLLSASYPEDVGRALFEAATETAQLLGWTAYDSGNHALARQYMLATLRLTQVTGNRMMGARILANMSHQARTLGHASQAVQLARAAVEGGRGHSTPRAMALFAVHEARALSTAQDSKGAVNAINETEKFFERAESTQDPGWLSYMDEAELVGEFCHCFCDLKQVPEALRFAKSAVKLTDRKYARTLGFVRMVLAQSQMLKGDLDQAIATASEAVEQGGSLHSERFLSYVTDFQAQISRYEGSPLVSHFNEQVAQAQALWDA